MQSSDVGSVSKPARLYYVDWLRALAMLAIFLYHSNRPFTFNSWHISNAERSLISTIFEEGFNLWMMPLFFFLSGAAVYYSLKSRSAGGFAKERVLRILVPFAGIGIFVFGVFQIYLERLAHGQFSGNFFQFYPHYFQGLYGFGGNFAFGVHLWYLMDIFLFSLILLPLFLPNRKTGESVTSKLARGLGNPWALVLIFVLMGLADVASEAAGLGFTEQSGSWSILIYLVFFFYGYLVFSNERILDVLRKYSLIALVVAIMTSVGHLVFSFTPSLMEAYENWPADFRGLAAWSWIVALVGLGSRLLNFSSPRLSYANEAVLPFYILHQPVILIVGFFVVQWGLGILPKYLIIVTSAFVIIMAVYELLVRRVNPLRFLFGMKLKKKATD